AFQKLQHRIDVLVHHHRKKHHGGACGNENEHLPQDQVTDQQVDAKYIQEREDDACRGQDHELFKLQERQYCHDENVQYGEYYINLPAVAEYQMVEQIDCNE